MGSNFRWALKLAPSSLRIGASHPRRPAGAPATALLEKVRRQMLQLEGVLRRIDDAEKRIRYRFDPVEKQLDDALQHEPPEAERIHASLLAVPPLASVTRLPRWRPRRPLPDVLAA